MRLTESVLLKHEATKELIKKCNINRANVRRMIRELEEKEEKVDNSFHVNIKNIEAEITRLKKDAPRVASIIKGCAESLILILDRAIRLS